MRSRRRQPIARALSLSEHIVFWVAMGVTLTSPFGGRGASTALRAYLRRISAHRTPLPAARDLSRAVYEMKRRKLIRSYTKDGITSLTLTDAGLKKKLRLECSRLRIQTTTPWDGRWRMVLFDIPERLRNARNRFRARLYSLGFSLFQRSIFICPHPCDREIALLAAFLEIAPYIHTLTAAIEGDEALRRHFKLPLG